MRSIHSSTLVLALLTACSAPPAASQDAAVVAAEDVGVDAPRAERDAGVDGGFTASSIAPCTLSVPPPFAVPAHLALSTGSPIADREHYVLTVLETLPGVAASLAADPALTAITGARRTALTGADVASCDAACVRTALVHDEAAAIEATIAALGTAGFDDEVAAELRASLRFERYVERGDDDTTLIRTALTESSVNLAAAFDRFAASELPAAMLGPIVHDAATQATSAWWQPLERVTVAAMLGAGRDEAVRYEPITTGENAAAIAAMEATDWASFPYVALLVPGQGPTDAVTALNPAGAARVDLAVARWQAHLAPFFLLSGGHVHPDRTVYSEAIEMKRYLMQTYAVPESAILVDPYARHTTTNLRNAVRELFAYGAPTDGRVLIVTDRVQSLYVNLADFGVRCDEELFYRPFLGLEALSPTDTCMTMAPISTTIAASDALDP